MLYDESGHKYTTFIVSKLAGISEERAYMFSYYSQFPDERGEIDAVKVGIFPIRGLKHRKQVLSTLHSLHGGDNRAILKRRANLSSLIREGIQNNSLMDWEIGVVIHSLADSFSHVKNTNKKLEAYDDMWGHFFDGHKPDIIANNPKIYEDYLQSLYTALKGSDVDFEKNLKSLLEYIPKLSKNKTEAIRQMRIQAEKLDFNEIDYNKVKNIRIDHIYNLLDYMEVQFNK